MTGSRRSVTPAGFHHGGNPIPSACLIGGLLVSGGVNPIDYASGEVPPGVAEQVDLAFSNIGRILAEAGATFEQVAKVDVYCDATHRDHVNAVWERYFPDPESRPARKLTSRTLPPGLLVQCEFLAVVAPAAQVPDDGD